MMRKSSTPPLSTTVYASMRPSSDHATPLRRFISSCAINSATPCATVPGTEPHVSCRDGCEPPPSARATGTTCTSSSLTKLTCSPSGDTCGSSTGLSYVAATSVRSEPSANENTHAPSGSGSRSSPVLLIHS